MDVKASPWSLCGHNFLSRSPHATCVFLGKVLLDTRLALSLLSITFQTLCLKLAMFPFFSALLSHLTSLSLSLCFPILADSVFVLVIFAKRGS